MSAELSHFAWLALAAAVALRLLMSKGGAPSALRLASAAVLILLLADVGLSISGLTILHIPAALAGGGLALLAVMLTGGGAPAGTSQNQVQEAISRWHEAAALAGSDGVLLWANAAWGAKHGVDEPVGKKWSDFAPQREAGRWRLLLDGAMRDGAASGLLDHRSSPAKDESWTSRAQAVAFDSESGDKRLFLAAVSPSSDEATLRRQSREIGHNLNNVLSAVVGNVGLAIETPGLDPTLRSDLQEAEEGALRAAELIHGLQALARGDAQNQQPDTSVSRTRAGAGAGAGAIPPHRGPESQEHGLSSTSFHQNLPKKARSASRAPQACGQP